MLQGAANWIVLPYLRPYEYVNLGLRTYPVLYTVGIVPSTLDSCQEPTREGTDLQSLELPEAGLCSTLPNAADSKEKWMSGRVIDC